MIFHFKSALDPLRLQKVLDALHQAPFTPGATTAGPDAQPVKSNLQLTYETPAGRQAGDLILDALRAHRGFVMATRPRTMIPPLFSRYEPGMAYGNHLDNPLMSDGHEPMRTDVSLTVFLSGPAEYDGGELIIDSDYGTQRFKGEPGDLVLYPSSMLHRVEQVTRGVRMVAVSWVQSLVRDPAQRKVLFDLALVAQQLRTSGRAEATEILTLQKCQNNLLRMWSDL